jgi:phage-related protein
MSTFTWSPAPNATQQKQTRVKTAVFGDGYQQRVADGINTTPRSWSLTFTRKTADVDAIEAFLDARNGTESFDWLPPSGVTGKWICKSWPRTVIHNSVQAISATFEEVFGD